MNEFTPGPWRIERGYIRGDNEAIVASSWAGNKRAKADERLIAAAPDLLRQRDQLLAALRRIVAAEAPTTRERRDALDDAEDEARALIAEIEAAP